MKNLDGVKTKVSRRPIRRKSEQQNKNSRSTKWIKILIVVLAVLAALLFAAAAAWSRFAHKPALPPQPKPTQEEQSLGNQPAHLAADRKEDCYTFLVVGRDDGGGGNTDTLMAVTYDIKNQTVDVMSIFRDTLVNVPWEIKKINSVYNMQSLDGLRTQVGKLLGFVPDYYFVIELDAVVELVDAIGGVDFEVPVAGGMHYDDPTQDLSIDIPQGMQHLDGKTSVKLLRWRKNNSGQKASVGDVGRVEIQHDFLVALAKQTLQIGNITKVTDLAKIVDKNLESNLSYGEMLWFGQQMLGLNSENIRFHSLPGNYGATIWSKTYHNYQSYVEPDKTALLALVNTYMNPYSKAITADMLDVMTVARATAGSSSSGSSSSGGSGSGSSGSSAQKPNSSKPNSSKPSSSGSTTKPTQTKPNQTKPSNNDTQTGGNSGTAKPETPTTTEPEKPSTESPSTEQPSGGETTTTPEKPTNTEKPAPEKPTNTEKPATEKPSTPTEPTQPAEPTEPPS